MKGGAGQFLLQAGKRRVETELPKMESDFKVLSALQFISGPDSLETTRECSVCLPDGDAKVHFLWRCNAAAHSQTGSGLQRDGRLVAVGNGKLACAAAEGGDATANDGHSASQATDDASITSAINTRFVRDELVRAVEIRVETRQGVVTLTGVVDSPKASLRALQLARSTPGVRRVDSRLRVRQ